MPKPIYTMDFETDPFEFGKRVYPFACGLFDGRNYYSVWSPKCAEAMVKHLESLPPGIIYMHNGGRFDIFYLMLWLDESNLTIINGRIVTAKLCHHELRDSYAILPMSLGAMGGKKEIDIQKLHRDCREKHKGEIQDYLRQDCIGLRQLVVGFLDEFGDFLTIGSAAMNQLKQFHPFEKVNKYTDEKFRNNFFFGGRVQCFQAGVINTPYNIYDVNSMYPHVMKNFKHPNTGGFEVERNITRHTFFVIAEGINRGAFPMRTKKGIDFTHERGTYACTIHEWHAAEETGMFQPTKVLRCYDSRQTICFDKFVDHFYTLRMKAKRAKDKEHLLFYKLILNSAYGKFAQNPDNFRDYAITHYTRLEAPWQEHFIHNDGEYVIWKKPVERYSYYNVAIGSSITGAARSVLMRAIHNSKNLLYCDTDSVIAGELRNTKFDEEELGAWKFEGAGNRIAIAGKKIYACFDTNKVCTCKSNPKDCQYHVKQATKGAKLTPEQIVSVARGSVVEFKKIAPTFKLNGDVQFIKRNIRRTV